LNGFVGPDVPVPSIMSDIGRGYVVVPFSRLVIALLTSIMIPENEIPKSNMPQVSFPANPAVQEIAENAPLSGKALQT
jgi:hypothetical protein